MSISGVQNNNMSTMYDYAIKKKEKEEEMKKLSSGSKINEAADDAAGLAVSEKMRAEITMTNAAQFNAKTSQNMVNTAEGAMTEINSMLTRATDLATSSANGTYTDVERQAISAEMSALTDEINRIASSTNFNGVSLLEGGSVNLQIGTSASESLSVDLTGVSTALQETFKAGTMAITTQEDALAMIDQVKEFVNKISEGRGEHGATYNRLDHTKNALSFREENLQRAESEIRDTDMAKSASDSSKSSIGLKAAQSAMQKEKEEKQGIMNLFG